MRTRSCFKSLAAAALLGMAVQHATAQCPDHGSVLTPTIRALLMLEKPAALTVEQWDKVIGNPSNWQDLSIVIYEEDRFGPCELPRNWSYVIMAGSRLPEKQLTFPNIIRAQPCATQHESPLPP